MGRAVRALLIESGVLSITPLMSFTGAGMWFVCADSVNDAHAAIIAAALKRFIIVFYIMDNSSGII
jgi:hypothetical protein